MFTKAPRTADLSPPAIAVDSDPDFATSPILETALGSPEHPDDIQTFLDGSFELVETIVSAVQNHDGGAVFRAASTLRSAAAQIGARRLSNVAYRLEVDAQNHDENLKVTLPALDRTFVSTVKALRATRFETSAETPQPEAPAESPMILLVDDDTEARDGLSDAIAPAGFTVCGVSSEEAAIAVIEQRVPDLLILGGEDPWRGVEAIERLRRRPDCTDLPIVFATEASNPMAIQHAYTAGATDFILRPIPFPLLAFRLRYLLRSARIRQQLRDNRERLAIAQRIARLGHWSTSAQSDRVSLSEQAAQILSCGEAACEVTWETFLDHVHDSDRHRVRRAFEEHAPGRPTLTLEHRLAAAPEDVIICQEAIAHIDGQGAERLTGTIQDVSERKRTERHIIRLAYHDEQTDLPNRRFLWDSLLDMIDRIERGANESLALVSIQLEAVNRVLESLGHDAADQLIKTIADRLDALPEQTDTLNPQDTLTLDSTQQDGDVLLARMATDCFMFVFRNIQDEDDVWKNAERLYEICSSPVEVSGQPVNPSACVGLAMYPHHGETASALLKNVQAAHHRASTPGFAPVVMFDESMHAKARERMTIEIALRQAIDEEGLDLYYQPKIDATTGVAIGMEALLRWNHPDLGFISPNRFISVAEDSGLIVPLGNWVLRTACAQTLQWRTEGFSDLRVAVNISAQQFLKPDFVDVVIQALTETGLPAAGLELEITESLLMRDTEIAVRHLNELRAYGVHIALDDFGTGYSSLSYLHRFPLDTLKIDRSFVIEMHHKAESATIVRAVILLAHNLNLRVVAEGVEELEQLESLRKLGCEEIQGYLFSRPLPKADFRSWIQNPPGLPTAT